MKKPLSRRAALKTVVAAGADVLVGPEFARAQNGVIQVAGRPVEIQLTATSPHTVRVTIRALENGLPQPIVSDGVLVNEAFGPPVASFRSFFGMRRVKCGNLTAELFADPLTIRIKNKNGQPMQDLRLNSGNGHLSFKLGDGPLLGLGQGGPQFDRRGQVDRMRSGQGGYQLRTHGGKVPVPFLIGTSGWAMFIHTPSGVFDLTGEEGKFQPGSPESALPLDVFITVTSDPASILAEYAKITGYPEMPPLWSFGYQQSHRTLGGPEEIVQEAKMFREKKLPCDTMIYLGTDFCPNGWNTHNGEFNWNAKAFPDPRQTIEELHHEHLKVVLHVVLEGRRMTGRVSEPCTAAPLPSGRRPDGSWPEDRQVSCYWPAHKALVDLGIDGWWPDQGDGLDAVSRLARNRMYFEGQQQYRPNERVFALHRNGAPGMQRFASFLWSGDVQCLWETLKTHVPDAINTGLSGIPYWGSDIGGFVPTQEFTGELYVRWFQFATFNPLFRSHGRDWRLRLPWGWNTGDFGYQETPGYNPDPKELHNAAIEPICKKYLDLRYRLIPYLYSAVKETCETGLPIIRALWLHYPRDAPAVARGDEYLFGRDILVAPVVEKGAAQRAVYLPAGEWYDFWNGQKLKGGHEIVRGVDLETIPVYVRAGAVIPMGPVKQYTEERVDVPMELIVYPGASGSCSHYEDDGKTFDFRRGEFMRVNITWNDRQRRLSLRLAKNSRMLPPIPRTFVVRLIGETVTHNVVFDGGAIELKL